MGLLLNILLLAPLRSMKLPNDTVESYLLFYRSESRAVGNETIIHACLMHIIMSSSRDFGLPEAYKQFSGTDIFTRIEPLVDWNSLKTMVYSLYRNDTVKGGRPNRDEITIIRTLFIRKLYGLTDKSTEKEETRDSDGKKTREEKCHEKTANAEQERLRRVRIKVTFKCLSYNLFTLMNLKKEGKKVAVS